MAKLSITTIAILLLGTAHLHAQDLSSFTAESLGTNRTLVSWNNPFGDALIQVNVQTSYDSLRNFGTVFEPLSPNLPQNGFVNNKGYAGKVYYRLFYVLAGGAYYFTPSKPIGQEEQSMDEEGKVRSAGVHERRITIRTPLNILAHLKPEDFAKFRDSITNSTKDTLTAVNQDEMVLKYYQHADFNSFTGYVGLNPEGFVEIKLPDSGKKKYKVIFKDDGGNHLFTINHVSDTDLVLDKTDFLHAGWFYFEIYQDDKIVEKNRVYLSSDF